MPIPLSCIFIIIALSCLAADIIILPLKGYSTCCRNIQRTASLISRRASHPRLNRAGAWRGTFTSGNITSKLARIAKDTRLPAEKSASGFGLFL
jgi:hypothetical protein